MNVILSEDVGRLGKAGDVIKVKDGFARNFLFPQNKAYPATAVNVKRMEKEKTKRQEAEEKQAQEAQGLADKLSKVSVTIAVEVNDLEKLYGSVTEPEIARALSQEGYEFNKSDIVLEKPIQDLGIYEVGVKLHAKVTGKVRVWVTKK